MKKLIFLLFPFLMLAQNPTNFPYGIKNTVAPSNSTPSYFVTQEVDGVHKKTPAANVEKTANKSDSYTTSSSTTYASTKALVDGLATKISGTGTINTIPKFTASGTIGNSLIQDDGTDIGIGGISTGSKLSVNGNIAAGNGDRTGKSVFPLYLSSSNSLGWKVADGTGLTKFEMYAGFSGINELRLLNSMKIIGSGQNLTLGTTNSTASITVANTTLGSVLLKTTTDDGINTLQVNGSTKTTALTLTTNPTTSASTYDFLTRNTSNGVVEKVLSNTIAMIASPAFTGTPTAPTATAGTNTTQIATTAFVQTAVAKRTFSITFSWATGSYAAEAGVYYVNRENTAILTPTFSLGNQTSGVPLPFNCKIIGITYSHNALASTDLQMRVYKVLATTTGHTQVASKTVYDGTNRVFNFIPTTDYDTTATFNCATDTVSIGFLNPTTGTGTWRSAAITILFQEL